MLGMCGCADQCQEGSRTGKGLGVLITGFSSCRTKFVPNRKLYSAQVGMVPLKAEMEEMVAPCLHQPSPLARVSFTERLAYWSAQATIRQSVQTGTGSPQFKAATSGRFGGHWALSPLEAIQLWGTSLSLTGPKSQRPADRVHTAHAWETQVRGAWNLNQGIRRDRLSSSSELLGDQDTA